MAEIPGWVVHTLTQDELNFKTGELNPVDFQTIKNYWNFLIKMSPTD